MKKIGFWPLFAVVIGSQVGSGVFMLPSSLAPYGLYGIFGLMIAAFGAISLAVTFASLSALYPRTGGPHVYVKESFGDVAGFFTGWTYWVISWVSTTAVIVAAVGNLLPLLGNEHSRSLYIYIEVAILLVITSINLKGVSSAGHFEVVLSIMKFTPLVLIPLCALFYFNHSNFTVSEHLIELSYFKLLAKVSLITLWGFIGLEAATTPAEYVVQPKKNIPLAVILGTSFVAVIYLINSLGIMGAIEGSELQNSSSPYIDVTHYIFGGGWYIVVSIISSIVCLSTINSWVLTSGQIALGLAEDGFLPKFFAKRNSCEAPLALLISGLGIVPLLFLTNEEKFSHQILLIIEFSVVAFLFVYLISVLSFIYLQLKKRLFFDVKTIIALFALLFCLWITCNSEIKVLLISFLFVVSGMPVYLFWYLKYSRKA